MTKQRTSPITRGEILPALNALADDARLRLLQLLAAQGEQRGQDLIAAHGGSQANVSRHLKQLVNAGLVLERRAGDANKHYRLNPDGLASLTTRLAALLDPAHARDAVAHDAAVHQTEVALAAFPPALRPFLDAQGRIAHFSTKRAEQKLVLDYAITKFEAGHEYTESEATALLQQWLAPQQSPRIGAAVYGIDAVTLRRALVEESTLRRTRDGKRYWRA